MNGEEMDGYWSEIGNWPMVMGDAVIRRKAGYSIGQGIYAMPILKISRPLITQYDT